MPLRTSTRLLFAALCATAAALAGCPAAEICVPGRAVECSCGQGLAGVQICDEKGTFGPCHDCQSPADAGQPDASAGQDASLGPDAGAPGPDASAVGTPCVFPTLYGPAPTAGSCEDGVAVTCDPATGEMTRVACAGEERCVTVEVHQVGSAATSPVTPDYEYAWAACVPVAAAGCAYAWNPASSVWSTTHAPECSGDRAVESCEMPIPSGLPWNAGTETGFVRTRACAGTDTCRSGVCVVGDQPCTDDRSWCDGDDVVRCSPGAWAVRTACPPAGPKCRDNTACARTGVPSAGCYPREVAEAEALCDPADFPGGCGPAGGELVCGQGGVGCFGAQECRCAIFELPCLMPELVCREFHDPGSTRSVFECQPPDSCAEGDRCDGDRAIRCDSWGRPQVFDCAAQGMVCAESSGFVGCADGTDTCSAISGPTCGAGETVLGCCDASGSFETGSAPVPCVPDREVRYDCPQPVAHPYRCVAGRCE